MHVIAAAPKVPLGGLGLVAAVAVAGRIVVAVHIAVAVAAQIAVAVVAVGVQTVVVVPVLRVPPVGSHLGRLGRVPVMPKVRWWVHYDRVCYPPRPESF